LESLGQLGIRRVGGGRQRVPSLQRHKLGGRLERDSTE